MICFNCAYSRHAIITPGQTVHKQRKATRRQSRTLEHRRSCSVWFSSGYIFLRNNNSYYRCGTWPGLLKLTLGRRPGQRGIKMVADPIPGNISPDNINTDPPPPSSTQRSTVQSCTPSIHPTVYPVIRSSLQSSIGTCVRSFLQLRLPLALTYSGISANSVRLLVHASIRSTIHPSIRSSIH